MRLFVIGCFVVVAGLFPSGLKGQYGTLSLSVGQASAETGSTVCVNVQAAGMRKIISMQYSLKWDSKVLELVDVKNFRLSGLSKENFGFTQIKSGMLTTAWIDNALKGIDLPNGTPIYQLCFRVKGKKGTSSAISLSSKPTPFEVINAYEQFIQLTGGSGKITVN